MLCGGTTSQNTIINNPFQFQINHLKRISPSVNQIQDSKASTIPNLHSHWPDTNLGIFWESEQVKHLSHQLVSQPPPPNV